MTTLGAVREGVVHRDLKRQDGTFRVSMDFGVLKDEGPEVKAGLEVRVGVSEAH